MRFTNKKEANQFYNDVLFESELSGCALQTMNELGRRDLYFLLSRMLSQGGGRSLREAMDHDWLFERCLEVQENTNGMLDLWAREHFKSTIITFGKSIQDILDSHSEHPFNWDQEITVGIFSHTRRIAKDFLTQIMQEFEQNELLKMVYPDVLYQHPRKESPRWSVDLGIVVKRKSNPKEATVEAWGLVDGQPTGKHFMLVIYDDVVTLESVTTPEQIKKTTDAWALSLNLGKAEGVRRYIGTRYNYGDTYKTIMERGAAIPRLHPATDDGTETGKSVFMPPELLKQKRKEMGPYIFAAQMLQNPSADAVQGFRREWFRFWLPSERSPEKVGARVNRYITVDPASEKKRDSDYTVMIVWALGPDRNYYIIDGIRDRMNLTERTRQLFRLHRLHRPIAVGYEKYGKDADIEHIQDKMEQLNYRFRITPLGGSVAKLDRIRKLVPLFENDRIWFPIKHIFVDYERNTQDLTLLIIDELMGIPVGEHDDIADCMARILDENLHAEFPDITDAIPLGVGGVRSINKVETEYDIYEELEHASGRTSRTQIESDVFSD